MDSLSWEEKYLRLRTEKDDIAKSKQSLLVNFLPILYSFHSLHFFIVWGYMSTRGRHLWTNNNNALLGTKMRFCVKRFFVLWVNSHMCCLFYTSTRRLYYARSLSLSLSSWSSRSAATNADAQTHNLTILSLSLSLNFCFSFSVLSFVAYIDTKTRDSFKQQRSVAHRIWTLLELDACTVHLL